MIQSGTIHLGADAEASPAWGLHRPEGWVDEETGAQRSQEFRTPDLQFPQPFNIAPTVVLSLAGIDADHQFNLRLFLDAEDVQPDEFNIRVRTWGDTLIYSVAVNWLAFDEH